MIRHNRRGGDNRLTLLIFAIQHAHRVALETGLAIFAQAIQRTGQIRFQFFPVYRTAHFATDRIQLHLEIRHVQAIQQREHQRNHFGVNRRMINAQRLRADLVKLPKTSGLRAFMPKHRQQVIELFRRRVRGRKIMLVIRPHDGRRAFGTQGHVPFAFVFNNIHFFLHDVGFFADAARKEFDFFQRGRPNFGIAVQFENAPRFGFNFLPEADFRR